MIRKTYFILLMAFSNVVFSENISLLSYPDMFGENKLYIKNVGKSPVVVLTAKLSSSSMDHTLSYTVPYTFVKIDGVTVKLKQSLHQYFPVELKSGEMAFLYVAVKKDTKHISYEIPKEFGLAHGTWYGRVKLDIN